MLVAQGAVEAFLSRKLRDSSRVKRLAPERVAYLLRDVPCRTKPYWHQKIALILGKRYPAYCYLMDMGTGKTKVALDLIAYRMRRGEVFRTLVLVPNVSNVGAWLEEAAIHQPSLQVAGLDEQGREERLKKVVGDAELVVATYRGWLALTTVRDGGKMKHTPLFAAQLEKQFEQVIFDESSVAKNHRTLTYQACRRLSQGCEFRIAMTGTPFDKNPEDLWSQFNLVDHGETLGTTLGLFRAAFFHAKKSHWHPGFEYTFNSRLKGKLARVLRNRSVRFTERECVDLPPLVGGITSKRGPMIRPVIMTGEALAHYRKVLEQLREVHGNFTLMKNQYVRMRQLSSGFLKIKTDEELPGILTGFDINPKLDALVDLLAEIPEHRKVVVFNEFRYSGQMIAKRLDQEGIRHVRVYGGTSGKNEEVRRFKEDPMIRVLIGSRSVAFGLNLQVANYAVFYESPDSAILRNQMEKRIHRTGQKRRTYIYDLVVKNSIEEKILRYLIEGKSLFDALIEGKESWE